MAPVDENVVTKRDERALTSPAVRCAPRREAQPWFKR